MKGHVNSPDRINPKTTKQHAAQSMGQSCGSPEAGLDHAVDSTYMQNLQGD